MELRRNSNDRLVGVCGGVERVAAHLYRVKSNSDPAVSYLVYVRSLSPQVVRCQCIDNLIQGAEREYQGRKGTPPERERLCKHCLAALEFEQYVAQVDPAGYRDEKDEQRDNLAEGRKRKPYRGSRADELVKPDLHEAFDLVGPMLPKEE